MTNQLVYDSIKAEQAVSRLEARLASVQANEVDNCKPNIDMGLLAIMILGVADYASKPEIRKPFEQLSASLFDIRHLDMLTDLGWAAWYAKMRHNTLLVTENTAKVPSEIVQRVTDRKQRMLRVVDYHLQDNPTASLAAQAIRSGTGYVDDASDLTMLAGLYENYRDDLSSDKKWYREDDAREAKNDAATLIQLLGVGRENEVKRAMALLTRIFICANESYDEVQAAASFIFRKKPESLEHFPSFYAAVRKPARTATQTPEVQDTNIPTQTVVSTPVQGATPAQPVQNRTGSRGPFVE